MGGGLDDAFAGFGAVVFFGGKALGLELKSIEKI